MGGEHEKQDDSDKYEWNGHEPDRGMPPESPGGKHEKKEGSRRRSDYHGADIAGRAGRGPDERWGAA